MPPDVTPTPDLVHVRKSYIVSARGRFTYAYNMHPILEWNAFVQLHYRYQDRYVAVSGLLALAAELFGDRHRTVVRNQRLEDMGASILWAASDLRSRSPMLDFTTQVV